VIPLVPELQATWRAAMGEVIALCRSYKIRYDDEFLENRVKVLQVAVGATTSCSRDLWAGRPSEVDDLLGSVVRLGKEQNIPTPTISACYSTLILRDRLARGVAVPGVKVPGEGHRICGPAWAAPEAP